MWRFLNQLHGFAQGFDSLLALSAKLAKQNFLSGILKQVAM